MSREEHNAKIVLAMVRTMEESNEPGEVAAAVKKLCTLGPKLGFPGFAAILEQPDDLTALKLENAVLKKTNAELWKKTGQAKGNTGRGFVLKTILIIAAIYGVYHAAHAAAPAKAPALRTPAPAVVQSPAVVPPAEPPQFPRTTGTDFRAALNGFEWKEGTAGPVIRRVAGKDWWVVVESERDDSTHADPEGKSIELHCLKMYGAEAQHDDKGFLAPEPYWLGFWMRWPVRAEACRPPATRGY